MFQKYQEAHKVDGVCKKKFKRRPIKVMEIVQEWFGGYLYWFGEFCFCLGGADDCSPRIFCFAVCHTNRRNKGLISVDRRTSLLSYVQYPVPYQSRLQRIYRSQCPKGD